jgi:hypothetical protein
MVWGLGYRVLVSGFKAQGLVLEGWVCGLEYRVRGLGLKD